MTKVTNFTAAVALSGLAACAAPDTNTNPTQHNSKIGTTISDPHAGKDVIGSELEDGSLIARVFWAETTGNRSCLISTTPVGNTGVVQGTIIDPNLRDCASIIEDFRLTSNDGKEIRILTDRPSFDRDTLESTGNGGSTVDALTETPSLDAPSEDKKNEDGSHTVCNASHPEKKEPQQPKVHAPKTEAPSTPKNDGPC